jgi:putative ABC transport system permease protein
MLDDLRFPLRALFRRYAVEDQLHEELRFHFDREVEKLASSGHSREEALCRARLAFGGVEQIMLVRCVKSCVTSIPKLPSID